MTIKWESWTHELEGQFVVMIRNQKTSYGLLTFAKESDAKHHATRLNAYPFERKVALYRQAMRSEIICFRHDMDLSSDKLELFTYEKVGKQYELNMLVEGKWYTVRRARYKKDLMNWIKEKRSIYSDSEMYQRMKAAIEEGKYNKQA